MRRPFSVLEKAVIALQVTAGVAFGVYGMIDVSDPGWADLQRALILMMVGIWMGGVVGAAALSRLVDNQIGRLAILVSIPFSGFVIIMIWAVVGS